MCHLDLVRLDVCQILVPVMQDFKQNRKIRERDVAEGGMALFHFLEEELLPPM